MPFMPLNKILQAFVLILTIIQSTLCVNIYITETSQFFPCSFKDDILVCDAKTMTDNSTYIFQTPSTAIIRKVELLNLQLTEIPANYLLPIADNLLSIKIQSISSIKQINQLAFSKCSNVISLEIKSQKASTEIPIDLNDVFQSFSSLEDLKLTDLNIFEFKSSYLRKLKSLSIESSVLNLISPDIFVNNPDLKVLHIMGLKNATNLLGQFDDYSSTSGASINILKLENCNLNSFPRFNANFVKNLSSLYLSRNPIERIELTDTINLQELQTLSLADTNLKYKTMTGLRSLTKLKSINLVSIKTLEDLPFEMEQLESLEFLNIDRSKLNKLSITLPSSMKTFSASYIKDPITISSNLLSRCSKLQVLNFNQLNTNNLQFLVSTVNIFEDSLRTLFLEEINVLPKELWAFLKSLKKLEALDLKNTNIDSIPNSVLNNLSNLKRLYLSSNKFRYETINTIGFQNISTHLTHLDLSSNQLTFLPPCLFYFFDNMSNVNLKDTSIDCDCNLLWLYERKKTLPAVLPNLNFTCSAGKNAGKAFYQLSENDLQYCSSNIDRCMPLKSGFYKLDFTLQYEHGDPKLELTNIQGKNLIFLFDYMKVIIKQDNKTFHSDIAKYELNRTIIQINQDMPSSAFVICLILMRNNEEYDLDYNCKSISAGEKVHQGGVAIWIGVAIGISLVIVLIALGIIFIQRRSNKKKGSVEEHYSQCSTNYSEPNDPYQDPDQYTEIVSNEEYSINQRDSFPGTTAPFTRTLPNIYDNDNLQRMITPSKSVDGGLDISRALGAKAKFRKSNTKSARNHTKRPREFVSLHNLSELEASLPRKYISATRGSIPQRYQSRDLPTPPEEMNLQRHFSDSPPPKPKFPSTDIKNLIHNADNHLSYFSKMSDSNNSLCTDESANHPHSGDSGLGVSKLSNHSQIRSSRNNFVII